MRGCLLIFLILFGVPSFLAQSKIGAKEYEAYASVLRDIYKDNRETYSGKSEFVFINQTKVDAELDLPTSKKYRNLVKNFKRKNLSPGILEKRFPRGSYSKSYKLVPQAEIDALSEEARIEYEKRYAVEKLNPSIANPGGSSWTTFYRKYPNASGYYCLSRVGFYGQFAIVNIKGDLGWNGFSRVYILKKLKGKWTVISSSGTEWIS